MTDSVGRKTFFMGIAGGASAQIVLITTGLISVPVGLAYLGPINFGIWMAINSIVAYLSLSQFGIGTAAAAMIAKEADRYQKSVIVRRAFAYLSRIAIVLTVLAGIVAIFPADWAVMFGSISATTRQEAVQAAIVMALSYFVRLPSLALISSFIGLQEVHLERFYAAILPALLSLAALFQTIHLGGSIVMLACLTGGAQVLAGVMAMVHFAIRHAEVWPGNSAIARPEAPHELVISGRRFFFIGVAAMVVWNTDNLVISYFLGPEAVTAYAVTFKLFVTAYSVFVVAISALWPMFGDAFSRNDWDWIRNAYHGGLEILSILGGLVWIGGLVFAEPIIMLWTGKAGYGGNLAVMALGGYGYALAMINLHANLLSGLNATRVMLWIGVVEAVCNFALSILFVHWWGIGGVALGTFVSALVTVFWLLPQDIGRQTQSRVRMKWRPVARHFCVAVAPGVLIAEVINNTMAGGAAIAGGMLLITAYVWHSWRMLPGPLRARMHRLIGMRRNETL